MGLHLGSMDLEVSYLHFLDQNTRRAGSSVRNLKEQPLDDVGYNQFTGNRLDLSVRLQLGRVREQLARIEYVEIISDVYPSSHHIYAYRPIAKVRVRNISQRPIETRVGFFVRNLMDQATESRPHYLLPGEETEIPVLALFNDAIRSIASFTIQTAEIYVRATSAPEYDDRRQAALVVHGRNDWNGDILTLRYFVTPEDPQIIQFTRQVLHEYRDELHTAPPELEGFHKMRILFDRFSSLLLYVNDPRKTQNRVQYPTETMDLRGGDCDDMAVAFASMLGSIGVAAAFVDIIPPDQEYNAHVYLLMDTGLTADQAFLVSTNPKRYVIRKNEFGVETVWIPLETTAIREGFEKAWTVGAESYTNEGLQQGGLLNGWVRVVDIPRL
jgi:transglutaminase-like putative cysteine protease